MSNLSNMNLDPNVPENEGAFIVVPAGQYTAVILADIFKNNRDNTGKILELKLQIVEGEHKGTILTDYLNITNKKKIAEKIGQGTLKRICRICNIEYPPTDTTYLYGKPLSITVSIQEFESNKESGKMLQSNKIDSYNQIIQTKPSQTIKSEINKENPW